MVCPTTNRVRGKSREARVRDRKRLRKANAKQALVQTGKIVKPATVLPGKSKKKLKKLEQKARLMKQKPGQQSGDSDMME